MSLQEQLRAKREETERWIKERQSDLQHGASELEARGRQVYADGVRTGRTVLARTTAEVQSLGRAAAQADLRRPPSLKSKDTATARAPSVRVLTTAHSTQTKAPARLPEDAIGRATRIAEEASHQGGAVLRGAIDEGSFGAADHVSAVVQALAHGDPSHLIEQYQKEIAEERARDAYDEANYGMARGVGRVAGFAGSLVAGGGVGAGAKLVARGVGASMQLARAAKAANAVKRIMPLTQAGLTPIAVVGGAASGVAGQAVSDVLRGRPSGVKDYAGAAVGGAAGALTMRVPGGAATQGAITKLLHSAVTNPTTAGAVEGGATTAIQGILNGRATSFEDVAESARGGAIGARVGDVVGKYGANALPRAAKGQLGETMTGVKAFAAGEGNVFAKKALTGAGNILPGVTESGPQIKVPLSKSYTDADFVTQTAKALEAKFGAWARLSEPQKRALREIPKGRYVVDHWLPSDIGRMGGVVSGAITDHWHDRE